MRGTCVRGSGINVMPDKRLTDSCDRLLQMLNCILGMVDKTKRALTILQQRTAENTASSPSSSCWTPGSRLMPAAVAPRIIPSPVQHSFPTHTPHHLSISPALHQPPQHQQKQSQSSPPTSVIMKQRNESAVHSDPRQQATRQTGCNGRGESFPPLFLPLTLSCSAPWTFPVRVSCLPLFFADRVFTADESVAASANLSLSFSVFALFPHSRETDAGVEAKRQTESSVKPHSAPEGESGELVTVERMRMERLISEVRRQAAEEAVQTAVLTLSKQEDSSESCWNCGRKAAETCSGCNVARYCGSFCQHKVSMHSLTPSL